MPFAELSPENRIQNRKTLLGLTDTFVAGIVGISQTRLSHALRGVKPLGYMEAERAVEILDELVSLQKKCDPVPVRFVSVERIEMLLSLMRRNALTVCVIDATNLADAEVEADAHE